MSETMYGKIQKMTAALMTAFLIFAGQCFPALASSVESVSVRSAALSAQTITKDGMVRVYLSSLGNPSVLDLTVQGNYILSQTGESIPGGSSLRVSFSASTGKLTLSFRQETRDMGRSFSLSRSSANASSGILIAQSRESRNPYPGDLSFEVVSNGSGYTLYTIAHVYMEDYLYGVLPYEMGNSSGLEALKAQAVAARTYTVRMMENRSSWRYDVKDTTSDQVYRGTPSGNANCVSAVNATKGIVLMYGSEYITTYYSASNGGQTEKARTGSAYAYMKVKDDPFDYANPNSTVKKKSVYANLNSGSNPSGLMNLLKNKAVAKLQSSGYPASAENTALKTLQSVTPHTPMYDDPSRLYTKMDFTFTVSTVNVSGQGTAATVTVTCGIFTELESLLGMSIQSSQNELWTVEKNGEAFVLQARRYGHGMGMSQRGAMYMAKLGYTYDQILGFYYEGCSRVQHNFTGGVISTPPSQEQQPELPESTDVLGYVTVKAKDFVNLRASGSMSARILGTAPAGAVLTVYSISGSWARVQYQGLNAYVNTGFISDVAEKEPSVENSGEARKAVVVTENGTGTVNLRQSPSVSAMLVDRLPVGTVVTVLSDDGEWSRLSSSAGKGYMLSKFLKYSGQEETPPKDEETENETMYASVRTESGSLNLRAQAVSGSRILTTIPRGTRVPVLERGETWSAVQYSRYDGYVMSRYLAFEGQEESESESVPEEPEGELIATVTTPSGTLNLRAQPNSAARILERIPPHTRLTVLEKGDDWSKLFYQGITGYVMTTFLTFDQTDAPSVEAPEADKPQTGNQNQTASVSTQSGSLNLRSRPRLNGAVLATIPRMASVTVEAYGDEWCAVQYGHYRGYVMTKYLSFSERMEQNPAEDDKTTEESAAAPEEPEKEDAPYITIGGVILDVTLEAPPFATHAETIEDTALYVMCAEEGEKLMEISAGEEVEILLIGDLWCRVACGNTQGYCPRSDLDVKTNDE